jgi:hypothetical protein
MALPKEPDPREKIEELSRQLRKLTFPTSPITIKLARFAANAFDAYLSGKAPTLGVAFGIGTVKGVPPNTRRGRPAVSDDTVFDIVSMLCKNPKLPDDKRRSIATIAKIAGVSQDTVETIRAEIRKVALTVPESERAEDGSVRDNEWERAEERALQVQPERRRVIIEGMADSIELSELIDERDRRAPSPSQRTPTARKPHRARGKLK